MSTYSPLRCPVVAGVCCLALTVAAFAGFPSTAQEWESFKALTVCDFKVTEDGGFIFPVDKLLRIKQGQIWRAITPTLIHLDLPHLLHNLLFVYFLTAPIEAIRGSFKAFGFILVVCAVSNVTQTFFSQLPVGGGMSIIWCGALGYRAMWRWLRPGSAVELPAWLVWVLLAGVLVGVLSGIEPIASYRPAWFPRIANASHVAGVITGSIVGMDSMLQRPKSAAARTDCTQVV